MAGNNYFTPDPSELGTQAYAQSGEAEGWYGFIIPEFTGDTFNISVPVGATGFEIEATTTVRFCLSPDATAPGSPFMELAPGETYIASGRSNIDQFRLWLPAGGDTAFVITFYAGNIGPIPAIFRRGASGPPPGPPPPPPPGSANIPINNVVHVMANGNNDTGTRNRMDLPFATPNAAEAAALPGDTVVVWQGGYNVTDLGSKRVSWLLLQGSALTNTSGSAFNATEDVEIGGSGVLQCSGGDVALRINNARTVRINGTNIIAFTGGAVEINEGQLQGYSNILASQGVALSFRDSSARIELVGNITSDQSDAISGNNLTGWIRGDITSNAGAAFNVGRPAVNIYGNVVGAFAGLASIGPGYINVYGDVTTFDNGEAAVWCDGGTAVFNIYGNVMSLAAGNSAVNLLGGGVANIHGNITSEGPGIVAEAGATATVHGNITAAGIAIDGDGEVTVTGNITTTGAASNGIRLTGGRLSTQGNITSSSTLAAVRVNAGTYVHVGDITNTGGPGLFAPGGSADITGDILSSGIAMDLNGGTVMHTGTTNSTANIGVRVTNGTLNNYGPIAASGQFSLQTIAGTTRQYGAVTNTAEVAVRHGGGMLEIHGNVSTAGDIRAMVVQNAGRLQVYGDVTSSTDAVAFLASDAATVADFYGRLSGGVRGLFTQGADNIVVHCHGPVIGGTDSGASIASGTVYFKDRVRPTTLNQPGIIINTSIAQVILMASARVEATGTGTSLLAVAASPTVRSYQASGNTLPSGTITMVGTYNVIV